MCKYNEKINIGRISYFKKPIQNTKPYANVSLFEIYQVIKGNYYKINTNKLREIKIPKEAKLFKASHFDYVTFAGTFIRRGNRYLIDYSGFISFDFDMIENPFELKDTLLNDSKISTALLFISPSGNGLKWVVPIDLEIATFQQYFEGVRNYLLSTYSIQVDEPAKDVSRACFLPHDPNVFINPKYLES